jgi:putative peptidoglycan lipid II flippase
MSPRVDEHGSGSSKEPEKQQASLAKDTLTLLPFTVLFRGGEAVLPLLLAAWFGRSAETNLQVFLARLFGFGASLLVAAFQDSAFVPLLTRVRLTTPHREALVLGAVLHRTLRYGVATSSIAFIVALAWVRFRQSADPLVPLSLGVKLTALYACYSFLVALRALLVGALQARRAFTAYPVASGAGMGLALLLMYVGAAQLSVVAIPLGLAAGELLACGILWRRLRRDVAFSPRETARPQELRDFVRLVGIEVLGNVVTRINPVVDQAIASTSEVAGAGTLLGYAFDLAMLPTSILQAGFLSVFLVHMSAAGARGDADAFRGLLRRGLGYGTLAVAALSAVLALSRKPVAELLFGHGKMDPAGTAMIAELLPFALAGTPSFAALLILARAHVSLRNTRIMLSMGVLNATLNATLNLAFFRVLGVAGIALATSVMHTVIAAVFWFRLRNPLEKLASEASE